MHPCFICIYHIVITVTVIDTPNVSTLNLVETVFMWKFLIYAIRKFLIYAILIVHENAHETYKHCVQVGLDD